ncbi:MAG: TrmB family transcriptional regulator [Promethearchaeota archaeon]
MHAHNISDKVIKALEGVNLTQYEISLYLTLIQEGELNARELSDKSSVPYSRIYNILSLLLDKGFVTRNDTERPSTFVANPPDEALMLARKKLMDDFDDHSKVIVNELNDIYLKKIDAPFQLPLIVYRGKEQVFTKAISLLEGASESILIALSSLGEVGEFGLIDIIKSKKAKGVEIKVLVEESTRKDEKNGNILSDLVTLGEVRMRDQIFGTGFSIDKKDAIILLQAKIFGLISYFGMQSDHQAFGSIANYYFGYLFDTAQPLDKI